MITGISLKLFEIKIIEYVLAYNMKHLKAIAVFLICFSSSVHSFADGGWTQITEIDGVIINHVTCLAAGSDGSVWFGGHQGLFRRYTDGQWEQLLSGYVTGVAVDSTGTVWVGEENKLLKIDGESLKTDTLDIYDIYNIRYLRNIVATKEGSVWGTSSGSRGIFRIDGENWTWYTTKDGLYDNWVGRVAASPEGDIWCAYSDPVWCDNCRYGGVSRFDGETWVTYNTDNGLASNHVIWITPVKKDLVYVSTIDGLTRFNGNTWETLPQSAANTMTLGPNGDLWIYRGGYIMAGLKRYDGITWTTYGKIPAFLNSIFMIAIDLHGTVWIGTDHGIFRYDVPIGIDSEQNVLPTQITIINAYPNPFNPVTTIEFIIPYEELIVLDIYNVEGQKVATLVNGFLNPGTHSVRFDASNLASGVYIYRLKTPSFSKSGKMLMVR